MHSVRRFMHFPGDITDILVVLVLAVLPAALVLVVACALVSGP